MPRAGAWARCLRAVVPLDGEARPLGARGEHLAVEAPPVALARHSPPFELVHHDRVTPDWWRWAARGGSRSIWLFVQQPNVRPRHMRHLRLRQQQRLCQPLGVRGGEGDDDGREPGAELGDARAEPRSSARRAVAFCEHHHANFEATDVHLRVRAVAFRIRVWRWNSGCGGRRLDRCGTCGLDRCGTCQWGCGGVRRLNCGACHWRCRGGGCQIAAFCLRSESPRPRRRTGEGGDLRTRFLGVW